MAMTDRLPSLVLDTNVVLDWLVFADAGCAALADAIRTGRVRWLASAAMRSELERVLTRGDLSGRRPDVDEVLAHWDRFARPVDAAPLALHPGWRCSDPDDQKFIELALHEHAGALLTRDRALLRMASRARAVGLQISPAARWSLPPLG